MSGEVRWLRPATLAVCLLFGSAGLAQGRDRPDRTDAPNVAEGDWVRPADILFIGDSESLGYFGAKLYRSLSTQPDPKSGKVLKVWSLWTCGSDAASWLRGATSYCGIRTCNGAGDCARDHGPLDRPGRVRYSALRDYVERAQPRITIVSLGTNMLTAPGSTFRNSYDSYLANVGHLIGDILRGHSQCLWIGPPQTALKTRPVKDYEQFVADVGRVVRGANCSYIDSNPLSDRNFVLKGDPEGIHYQGAGERDWEANVWRRLQPILTARLAR